MSKRDTLTLDRVAFPGEKMCIQMFQASGLVHIISTNAFSCQCELNI